MRIGFIGAGKVGFTFGKYLRENTDLEVGGYYSAHKESAREAAEFTDTRVYDSADGLIECNDIIFLTVPDGQIEPIWEKIRPHDIRGKFICHASGAETSKIFSGITEAGAFGYSIHPMYAISSKYESYRKLGEAFFTIEGDGRHTDKIKRTMEAAGLRCVVISDENKAKYHCASVFASNLVTGLLAVAEKLLTECGFDEVQAHEALLPLFLGNAAGAAKLGVTDSLTGPVERGDAGTVAKHLAVLSGDELMAYRAVSRCLVPVAEKKHPDRDYKDLLNWLNGIGE